MDIETEKLKAARAVVKQEYAVPAHVLAAVVAAADGYVPEAFVTFPVEGDPNAFGVHQVTWKAHAVTGGLFVTLNYVTAREAASVGSVTVAPVRAFTSVELTDLWIQGDGDQISVQAGAWTLHRGEGEPVNLAAGPNPEDRAAVESVAGLVLQRLAQA